MASCISLQSKAGRILVATSMLQRTWREIHPAIPGRHRAWGSCEQRRFCCRYQKEAQPNSTVDDRKDKELMAPESQLSNEKCSISKLRREENSLGGQAELASLSAEGRCLNPAGGEGLGKLKCDSNYRYQVGYWDSGTQKEIRIQLQEGE